VQIIQLLVNFNLIGKFMKKIIAACLLTFSFSALAWQPTDTVQLVIPFPPGGSTDVIGRIVAEGLRAQGVPNIVVVNRPGAGGVIGTNAVIEAKPDGHTILLTGTSFMFNRLQNTPGANYDLTKSLSHIGLVGIVPNQLYSKESLANLSLKDIVQNIKNGQQYSWGTASANAEYTAQLLETQLGVKLNIIPYKGSAPAIVDLSGGHIDFVIDTGSSAAAAAGIENKKINLVASFESKKDSANTVDAVVPGVVTRGWFGLSLPKGVDNRAVIYYNKALNQAINDPAVKEKLSKVHVNVKGGTPQAFSDFIENDYRKYLKISDVTKK
jgi:tripartite-type tricarboxylate transporter receptor subunit TctC